MRLSKNQIAHLAYTIVKHLVSQEKIIVDDKNKLIQDIERVLTEEFALEDQLDNEVKSILSKHIDEIRRGNLEYNEMFRKVKQRLAKEKGIVL